MPAENCPLRRSLWLLWLGQCIAIAAMEMSGPFWPLYLRELSALQGDMLLWSAVIIAAPMVTAFLTATFWGRMGDRYGHKWMVLRALLALALTQWLIAVQSDPLLILLLRLLQGALAGVIAAAMAYGLRLCDAGARSRTLGYLQSATAAGTLLGPVLGGMVSDLWGFTKLFQMSALACVVVAGILFFGLLDDRRLRQPGDINEARPGATRNALGSALLQGLLVALLLSQVARMMPQSFFALYVESGLQSGNTLIGVLYGATGLAMLLAAPLWGRRLDQQGTDAVLLQAAILALCCAYLMLLHSLNQTVWSLLALRFAWGICLAATMPSLFSLLSRVSVSSGRSVGPGQAAVKLGNFSGYLVGGLAATLVTASSAFIAVALTYLLLAVWLLLLRQKTQNLHTSEKDSSHVAL